MHVEERDADGRPERARRGGADGEDNEEVIEFPNAVPRWSGSTNP
jgi:hypothetical protein